MRIQSSRLGFRPSASALDLVDACSQDAAPEYRDLLQWHTAYVANHRLRIAHDLDIIKDRVPMTSRILEFGSIPLLLTTALTRYGYQVSGCDIAPERYFSAIRSGGLDVVKCDVEIERLPFANESFDAVVFNELFEHLRINPIFTLSEVLRVMKPDAILMLSSPNLKSLGGIRNFLFRGKAFSCSGDMYAEYKKLTDIGHMGHVREYTPTEVVEFLTAVGFEVGAMVFRGEYAGMLSRTLIGLMPSLSPFVSYVARKPGKVTPS